ncbi:MAG: hypothetical protein K6F10_02565 [Paludibacteraceae bacterium]|nr:hypothetical protein [Paludibacteraceae bacterium]
MKRTTLFIGSLLFAGILCAQTLDDVGRMAINVQRPTSRNIPAEALNQLEDKMHQIITTAGISDNAINRRFALTTTVSVVKKDIISGSPARVSQTLEIAFYVKDLIDKKEYGHATISSVGVGLNENKAFIMAFSNIKPGNPRLQKMIDNSKELIVAYYRTNIDNIIADAYIQVQQGNFDKALYQIAQVPDVCTDCTQKCRAATIDIYQKKIDSAGEKLLQSARAAWTAEPNADGAVKASRYLAKIDLLAACQPQVSELMEEMKAKVMDDERKAWEFALQQYEDEKAREQRDFEFHVQQYKDRQAREEQLHQEALEREKRQEAREQRDFEYAREQFHMEHEKDMAIISASRQVALEVAKQIPYMK